MDDRNSDSTSDEKTPRRLGGKKKSPRSPRGNCVVSEEEPTTVSLRSSRSPRNTSLLSDNGEVVSGSGRSSREKLTLEGESGDANERATPASEATTQIKRSPSAHKVYARSLTSAHLDYRTPSMAAIPGPPGATWREMTAQLTASAARQGSNHFVPPLAINTDNYLLSSYLAQPPASRNGNPSPRLSVPVRSPFAPPTALDALLASIELNSSSGMRERSNSEPFINSWSYHSSSPIVPITHPQLRRHVSKRSKTVRQTSLVFRNHPQTQHSQHSSQSTRSTHHHHSKSTTTSSAAPLVQSGSNSPRNMTSSHSSGDLASSMHTISTGSLDTAERKRRRDKTKDRPSKEKLREKDKEKDKDKEKEKSRDKDKEKDREREREKRSTREAASPSDNDSLLSSPRSTSEKSDTTKSSKRSGSKSQLSSEKDRLKLPVRSVTLNSGITQDIIQDSPLSSPTSSSYPRSMPATPKSMESDESDDWASSSPSLPHGLTAPQIKSSRYGSHLQETRRSPRSSAINSPYSVAGSPPRSDSAPGSQLGTPTSARSRNQESGDPERRSRSRAKSGSEGVYYTDSEPLKARSSKRPKLRTIDGNVLDDMSPASGRRSARKKSEVVVPLQPLISPRPRVIPNPIWLRNKVDEDDARMFCSYLQENFKDTQFCEAVILMHTEIVCSRYLLDNLLSLYACAAIEQTNGISSSPPDSGRSNHLGTHSDYIVPPSPPTYESDFEIGQSQRQRKPRANNASRPTKPPQSSSRPEPLRFSSLRQGAVGGVTWADMPTSPTSTSSTKRSVASQTHSTNQLSQLAQLQPPSILQTSILNFIKKWVRLNTQDFTDDTVLQDMVRDFVVDLRRKPGIECQMAGLIWDLFESSLHKLDDDPNATPLSNYDVLLLLGKTEGTAIYNNVSHSSSSFATNSDDGELPVAPLSPHRSSTPLSVSSPSSTKLKLVPSLSTNSLSSSSSSGSVNGTSSTTPGPPTDTIPEYLFKFTEFPSPIIGRETLGVIQANVLSLSGALSPSSNSSIGVLDVSPLELARQWCLLDHTTFAQVRFRDFLRFASHPEDCTSLDALSKGFNHATSWVAYQILRVDNPKKRGRVAVHMIALAEELFQLNNFHAFFGVIIGLTQLSVARLRATWKQVGKKELKSLRALQQLISPINNFAALRNVHDSTPPPFVPLTTLFLRDLVMLAEASHDGFINPSTNSVNVDKILMIEKLLGRLHSAQRNHYKFVPIKCIQSVLLQGVAVASEELEAWSARVEPGRDS